MPGEMITKLIQNLAATFRQILPQRRWDAEEAESGNKFCPRMKGIPANEGNSRESLEGCPP